MKVNGSKIKDRARENNITKMVLFIQDFGTKTNLTDSEKKSSKAETSTKETLLTGKLMAMVNVLESISLNMQVNGIKIFKTDTGEKPGLMGLNIMEPTFKENRMDMVFLVLQTVRNIQANLRKIKWMGMEYTLGKVRSIQVIGKIIKKMVKEKCFGILDNFMMEIGQKTKNLAKEYKIGQMDKFMMEIGQMGKYFNKRN